MTMDESRSMEEATSLPSDIDPYWKEEKRIDVGILSTWRHNGENNYMKFL